MSIGADETVKMMTGWKRENPWLAEADSDIRMQRERRAAGYINTAGAMAPTGIISRGADASR